MLDKDELQPTDASVGNAVQENDDADPQTDVSSATLDAITQDIDDAFYRLPQQQEILEALSTELFTVQDVVRYLVSLFSQYGVYVGHGTDNYWDEALEMVQAVMYLQPPCDDSTLNSRLTRSERELIAKMAIARAKYRIPTPYLTHRAFFAGHQFYVDRRVIIPRLPQSAYWTCAQAPVALLLPLRCNLKVSAKLMLWTSVLMP